MKWSIEGRTLRLEDGKEFAIVAARAAEIEILAQSFELEREVLLVLRSAYAAFQGGDADYRRGAQRVRDLLGAMESASGALVAAAGTAGAFLDPPLALDRAATPDQAVEIAAAVIRVLRQGGSESGG